MKLNLKKFSSLPFSMRLISLFMLTSLLSLLISLSLNQNINRSLNEINSIYTSNNTLNEVSSTLTLLHNSVHEYLETKSTDSLNQYYYYEQQYQQLLSTFRDVNTDLPSDSMERNIKNISSTYLDATDQAIEAKRARNTGKYRSVYAEATEYYTFLNSCIYSLNNEQFISNSNNYQGLAESLRTIEKLNNLITIAISFFNILLIIIMVHQITKPLLTLAQVSNRISHGDFDVELPISTSDDELGIVTNAFNQMIVSIRRYIEQVKSSMEAEKKAQERELLMEAHLKEAQLRYYQAQINPHFLFNSLNAGTQLSMMEDAEKTYSFLQSMAEFFRYSMKSLQTDVYLREEVELVENYVAIMNVRFSGDIHYETSITCDVDQVHVPCMILQPIVENAIQYGIRNISWEGRILLSISQENTHIRIRISDNGIGISPERINEILQGKAASNTSSKNSNGIGLGNVIERLKLYYNSDDLFHIESKGENLGTTVTILIPLQDTGE